MRRKITASATIQDHVCGTDCHFVITGASGWLGLALTELLESALGEEISGRLHVFASSRRDLRLSSGRMFQTRPLGEMLSLSPHPIILFHCAFITKDKLALLGANDFIAGNEAISNVIEAAVRKLDVRGLFMPSSGAVYRPGTRALVRDFADDPYGVLKLRDEQRFGSWARDAGVSACIPRVFNLSGPYINKVEHYALASMILSVLRQQPISIRSDRIVKRSFVHIVDLLELALAALFDPRCGDSIVFDTAGEDVIELDGLAAIVRDVLDRPCHPIRRPNLRPGEEDIYVGDGTEFERLLMTHRLARRSMQVQILDTAAYLERVTAVTNEIESQGD